VLNTALPFITKDLHYHKDGVLSSAVVLGAAAGAITAGKLADVLGPRHAQVRSLGRGPGSQIWGRHAQVRAGGGGVLVARFWADWQQLRLHLGCRTQHKDIPVVLAAWMLARHKGHVLSGYLSFGGCSSINLAMITHSGPSFCTRTYMICIGS
jgi:MFS family permease